MKIKESGDNLIVTLDIVASQGRSHIFVPNTKIEKPIEFIVPKNSNLTFNDWIPVNQKEKESKFCSVDRSLDVTRLSGLIYYCNLVPSRNGNDLLEDIMHCSALVAREGGRTDKIVVPHSFGFHKVKTFFGEQFATPSVLVQDEVQFIQRDTWLQYNNTMICSAPGWNLRMIFGAK